MRVAPVRRPRPGDGEITAERLRAVVAAAPPEGAELDDRRKPGGVWVGRGFSLSRSHLTFRSRRMCYQGRQLLVLVHLVDDKPAPLFGQVRSCDYDSEGMHRTVLELMALPLEAEVQAWIRDRDVRAGPAVAGTTRG
jgi:hypothetical protein